MKRELPSLEVKDRRRVPVARLFWPLACAVCCTLLLAPQRAGSLPGEGDFSVDPLANEIVVARSTGPALLDAATGSSFCPEGWDDLGTFDLTAYVLARETEFATGPVVESPCGLSSSYYAAFLYGSGVSMQGSGRARDGSIVHYAGNSCFELTHCPLAANGRCARAGHTVAVDPAVIPLGSELMIEGLGRRRAEDTGGGIRGHHIDVYYGEELTYGQAMAMSRIDRRVCRKLPGDTI